MAYKTFVSSLYKNEGNSASRELRVIVPSDTITRYGKNRQNYPKYRLANQIKTGILGK